MARKRLTLTQVHKQAYDNTRSKLLRQGVDRDSANAKAREAAALKTFRVKRKRTYDTTYHRTFKHMLEDFDDDEMARAAAREYAQSASSQIVLPSNETGRTDASRQYCTFARAERDGIGGYINLRPLDFSQLPARVQANVPLDDSTLLGGHFQCVNPIDALRFYTIIVGVGGKVHASVPLALSGHNSLANAFSVTLNAGYATKLPKVVYFITIPLGVVVKEYHPKSHLPHVAADLAREAK